MTEPEKRLLVMVVRWNDDRERPCGFTITSGGGRGSNFVRINDEKRMQSLQRQGLVELGAHRGWWVTDAGRAALAAIGEGQHG